MGVNAAAVVPGKKAASGGKVTDPCLSASSLRVSLLWNTVASGGGSFLICHAETTVDTFNRKMFSVSLVGDDAALRCNRTSVSPQLRKMIIMCLFFFV